MRRIAALTLGASLCALSAGAQPTATITGRVVDKVSKAGIPGAEVSVFPDSQRVMSDREGHFRLERVAAGNVAMLVRRLGFRPESAAFPVIANDALDLVVELTASAQQLDTVTVAEREVPLALRRLAPFYERKRVGSGRYFDPEMLEKQQHRRLGDVITSGTPGARLVRSLLGTTAWVATSRRPGFSLTPRSTVDENDRNRGADPRACYPDVYVDGAVAYSFGSLGQLFDINSIPVSNVAAVEFYSGPSQTPLEYNKTSAVCGVVLIWTK